MAKKLKYNFKPLLLEDQIGAYLLKNDKKKVIIWRNFGKIPRSKAWGGE